jgi:hypothetical protein
MQCMEPGQVIVLPYEGDAETWAEMAVDEMGPEISLEHSTEDILRHYHLEEELGDLR